ncbi:MAG: hypothetical protein DME25_15030 [Verrucomicrobia bacterium]|nr:MAG: hypothetical protein DME25_15030 [Verrucomicrobiota bacterium]
MSSTTARCHAASSNPPLARAAEKQITRGPGGRILTNIGVWSPDSQWIAYDTRSDVAGDVFDGARIELVNVETGEVKALYQSQQGAYCGAVTFSPVANRVAFILGPENPTPDWHYGVSHRQGLIVDSVRPGVGLTLDARDLTPPFTPEALRGGSHLHVWDGRGEWVSFTYHDALLEPDLRDLGVSVPLRAVPVKKDHPRNHDGHYFSVLVTRSTANPKPGSDEIKRACEEGWVGTNGYLRPDGARQERALAFQGHVVTSAGATIAEVFIVDLPEAVTNPGDGELAGTITRRPAPPKGTVQRRLTYTAERRHPGLAGPRHWLRSSPDGARIAFLMKDDAGIAQLWTVAPNGGAPAQLTRNPWPIASAFTWSPDGRRIAQVLDNSVAVTDARTGATEACVFSPDNRNVAYVRRVLTGGAAHNQIFVLTIND